MVTNKAKEVTNTANKPTKPKRLAFRENWVRDPKTWREILSGTKLSINQRCNWSCTWAKIGKAVKMAKPSVKRGTKAKIVVKVRELAVMPSLTSRKRSHKVRNICRQGNWTNSLKVERRDSIGFMTGMMPSP